MPGCHKIKNFYHCRKKAPGAFDKMSFRTKRISKKTMIVIGCPKGKWNNARKRCRVSMKIQKTMKRVGA